MGHGDHDLNGYEGTTTLFLVRSVTLVFNIVHGSLATHCVQLLVKLPDKFLQIRILLLQSLEIPPTAREGSFVFCQCFDCDCAENESSLDTDL